MKFIKKNRYTVILILVFILLLCLGIKIKDILMPDDKKEFYGNRLNSINEHIIEESLYNKIKSELEKDEKIDLITYREQGKIINFIVTVNDKTTIEDAKKVGNSIITYFSEDDIGYYTIQIYIKKNDESLNNFPIIGAKNPLTASIIWTHDREISKEDDKNEE